jgi:hypothetical protein
MNPLEELDDTTKDSKVWRKAGLYWEWFEYHYIHPGSIFIPCHGGMTPNGLRAQYLIPNLSLCAIAYPSIRPFLPGHIITQSREIRANSFLAERKPTTDREPLYRIFLEKPSFFRMDFFTRLGPQVRLLPVPNFGVNICPFNYRIKVILFRNWLQLPTSSNWICSTPILSPHNSLESSSRSKP